MFAWGAASPPNLAGHAGLLKIATLAQDRAVAAQAPVRITRKRPTQAERLAMRNGYTKVEHVAVELLIKTGGPLVFSIFAIISSRGRSGSEKGAWPR